MRKFYTFFFITFYLVSNGQNIDLANGLFGNDWIDYDKTYVKIKVAEDDIYKLTFGDLTKIGVPLEDFAASSFKLQCLGETVPIYVSNSGQFSENDYILFYGKKNRAELDKALFKNPETDMMNDRYSMVSDTSAYFLSWGHTGGLSFITDNVIDYNIPLPETRVYRHINEIVYGDWHYKPVENSQNVRYSSFVQVEGFGTDLLPTINVNFPVIDRVNIGVAPTLSYRFGTNRNELNTAVSLNGKAFKNYYNKGYKNYLINLDTTFDYSQITDNFALQFSTSGDSKIKLGNVEFSYTRTIDASKEIPEFITIPTSTKDQYFKIKNYSGEELKAINITTSEIYTTAIQNNNLVLFVPASQNEQVLSLVNESTQKPILKKVNFIDFSLMDHDYVFLTSSKLNNNSEGEGNPFDDYISFRQSPDGGSFNPVAINVEDLYDQFAYGIDRHFLAIRHFAHFIKSNWTDVRFMFIVGKGREYPTQRKDFQINNPISPPMLVPTYGQPGSDNLLVSGVNTPVLLFPTSRFAANDKTQIYNYLDKVKAHVANKYNPQTIEDRLWMKNILHLSGGDPNIQASIRNDLDRMAEIIETSKMGAKVTTFAKFSSSPVEVALSDELKQKYNEGIAITTFFGHSATGNLDFSLGDIRSIENKNKYPFMIALGCSAGNIHGSSTNGVSEEYVSVKDKGMIAFLASTGSAYQSQQYDYGKDLYALLGSEDYGKPIGESINKVIEMYKDNNALGVKTFLEQVTLHGDPAIKIDASEGVDLIPDGKTAMTIPSKVNSYDDSFSFCFDLVNIGFATSDSINIHVIHTLADGSTSTDTTYKVVSPRYRDQECINLPITDPTSTGKHLIKVNVDSENVIAELPSPEAENNNELSINGTIGYTFYMLNNTAMPIYPNDFGITNNKRPTLLASTFNAFDKPQDFIIQFDTSGYFNSPSLVSQTLKNQVALIEWPVPYDLGHEKVYYWRISPDSTNNQTGLTWNESSFMYHNDIEGGWNQSHYHQFLKDDFENMVINPETRKMEFARNFQDLRIINRIYSNSVDRPHFYLDGDSKNVPFTYNAAPGISVTLVDNFGKRIYTPFPETEYGTFNERGYSIPAFLFKGLDKQEVRQNLIRFLKEQVKDGYQVIINTILTPVGLDFNTSEWSSDSITYDDDLFSFLESKGAEEIRDMETKGGLPYILSYIEGDSKLAEEIAINVNDEITATMQFLGIWYEGEIKSTIIGPAKKWEQISWSNNVVQNDSTVLIITGIKLDGTQEELFQINSGNQLDISAINSTVYPSLKLLQYTHDVIDYNPSNINYWRVKYDKYPDIAIVNNSEYLLHSDSLQQGDAFKFKVPFINNSLETINSVKATITIRNQKNEEEVIIKEVSNLKAQAIDYISFQKETANLIGDYSVDLNINSDKNPIENYYFNNYGNISINVFKENINPILDVTFDGVHILDKDIVSPNPLILINLKDENPYLLLDDTSMYTLKMLTPDGKEENIAMNDERLLFIPSTSSVNNLAQLEFKPSFVQEGTYKLSIKSKDKSGNVSGSTAYEVTFQVLLKEQISEVYNYPNPFSTSTEFIFTLTGREVPENFTLQIMTISGKVVKEINKEEFGPIRIGLNRSQYKWNGRDEFGSPLGNGVYLYRILTKKSDGNAFDLFETENTSQFFKEGWGKMVIIR